MLKLTEQLFAMDKQAKYVDFYERALYNHILSTQHPIHGGYVYFTSARPQHYRVYSQVNQAMWCCVGTGMENHGKYGEFIYSHQGMDTLYVNLFIASQLDWKEKHLRVTQETRFPYEPVSRFIIEPEAPDSFTLMMRHPGWAASSGFTISVNGNPINQLSSTASYVAITRTWHQGDILTVSLPMSLQYETLPNESSYIAL
jgi:DUF1680 family protein